MGGDNNRKSRSTLNTMYPRVCTEQIYIWFWVLFPPVKTIGYVTRQPSAHTHIVPGSLDC